MNHLSALWRSFLIDRRLPFALLVIIAILALICLHLEWFLFTVGGQDHYALSIGSKYATNYAMLLLMPWFLLAPGLLLSPILAIIWFQQHMELHPTNSVRIPLFPVINYWSGSKLRINANLVFVFLLLSDLLLSAHIHLPAWSVDSLLDLAIPLLVLGFIQLIPALGAVCPMWCVVYEAMYQKKWNPLVVALVVLVCYYLLPLLAYNDYWEVPEHSTDLYILLYLFGGVLNTIILYYASRLGGNQCH